MSPYNFNPFTGNFDEVGTSSAPAPSSNYVFINPIVSTLSVSSPLIFLEHDMTLTGTLTLLGTAELLVI